VEGAPVHYIVRSGYGEFGDAQRTDAQGKFQNSFLPLGKPFEISLQHNDFERYEQELVLSEKNPELDITVTLARRPHGKAVRGVVRDLRGKPVAAAHITNYGKTSDRREATTGSQGEFALHDLLDGYSGYQIYVVAKGFAPQRVAVEPANGDMPAEVNVSLSPGHTLRGRLLDENGKPVNGAVVSPQSSAYSIFHYGESARTGEDGQFDLDSLPEDARFYVSAPTYPNLQRLALQLDTEEPVTLTLDTPGVLRGRVLDDSTGEPVRQFRVKLGFSPKINPNDKDGTYDGRWYDPGITVNSVDGKFIIQPITDGMPVSLTVLAENYERAVVTRAVAAKADEAKETTISLQPVDLSQRYTLRIKLLNHAGHPTSAAQLRLIVSTKKPTGPNDNQYNWVLIDNGQLAEKPYCDQFLSGITDAEGGFEFKSILPGKHLQLAYWGDGVPRGRSLDFVMTRAGEEDTVAVNLPRPARLRGTIKRGAFPKAGSIRLSVIGAAFQEYERKLTDDTMSFEFDDLPPGEYQVSVGSQPVEFTENGVQFFRISSLASQKVELKAGETKEVSFTEPSEESLRR
jgi:hypothetical protein